MVKDLRGADLRGASLRNANFHRAILRGANMSHADLRNADLSGADLRNVNFGHASMYNVNLYDANLRGADLRGANLDFSCWPLWCGSLDVILDDDLLRQRAYHLADNMISSGVCPPFLGALVEYGNRWSGVRPHWLRLLEIKGAEND